MLLIILFVVIIVLGLLMARFSNNNDNLGIFIFCIGAICLFTVLLVLPIFYYEKMAEINEYNALKTTVTEFRGQNHNVERAAIILEVTKMNMKIANAKYWNDTIFDIYIPDEFAELELIK